MKNLTRWTALAIVVLLYSCGSTFGQENETLDKAVDWLVAQQDESGAFKSKHYGAMKQGAAMTSLALYSLSMTPEDCREKHEDVFEKAFEFLLPGTTARGRVANPDGSLDHPVYSTAMLLVAAKRLDQDLDPDLVTKLLDFLVRSQCVAGRGFEPNNPNYGGWDVIGPDIMPGKTSGTNVSVARFVLEAFASHVPVDGDADSKIDKGVVERVTESRRLAVEWLQRLHTSSSDGGFHFSAQPDSALNKSRSRDDKPKPYGSATCDGLIALHFSGAIDGDPFKKASSWIASQTTAEKIGGFENQKESAWPKALKLYYLQSFSLATKFMAGVEEPKKQTSYENIEIELGKAQKEDGRFQNASALMRENDPLVATSFAIIALGSSAD